jgi:hypothetical protein
MKEKEIRNQMLVIASILMLSVFSSCNAQNNNDIHQESDSIKLEVRILNMLPVGWGDKYIAIIENEAEGRAEYFNDTIMFGITASRENVNFYTGDLCLMTLKNSGEISKTTYLPPITGTVSKHNEIWLITEIDRATDVNQKRTFVGTAVMSEGKAMFIWDFADSQAFYLDGLQSWDEKYLNRKITVEGVLKEYIDGVYSGPVLTNWKISDGE